MKVQQYSIKKKNLLRDISQNSTNGVVCLLFEVDKNYRKKLGKELKEYGKVIYDKFPSWFQYIGVEINNSEKAIDLVDRLYSEGLEGILDVGVDSREVVLPRNHLVEYQPNYA